MARHKLTSQTPQALISLRFFAVLWLVLYGYIRHLDGALPLGLIDKGYLGVEAVAILAGFALSHIYPAFPILRHRPVTAVALACLILALVYVAFGRVTGFPLTEAALPWGAWRVVPCAMLGSALHLAWRAGAVVKPWIATLGAVTASLTVVVASSFARSDIVIVVAVGLLVLSAAGLRDRDGEGATTIMSSRLLVALGRLSFTLYLVSVPWLWLYVKGVAALLAIDGRPLPFFWWLAGLLAAIPLAMLSHHFVIRPLGYGLRNLEHRLRDKFAYQLAKQS